MIGRVRYTKPTIAASITAGIIGMAVNALYLFREMTVAGNIHVIAILSLILGIIGTYLTHKKTKSAAFYFLGASAFSLLMKFSGAKLFLSCIYGFCYAFSSMNNFQLINLGTPMLESSNDVIGDMLYGKMMKDAASKQDEWLKSVNDFISRYTVFAYYGYLFSVIACMFLNGAWLFAPEMWNGYSREFWALLGAGGLVTIAGIYAESARRKI